MRLGTAPSSNFSTQLNKAEEKLCDKAPKLSQEEFHARKGLDVRPDHARPRETVARLLHPITEHTHTHSLSFSLSLFLSLHLSISVRLAGERRCGKRLCSVTFFSISLEPAVNLKRVMFALP